MSKEDIVYDGEYALFNGNRYLRNDLGYFSAKISGKTHYLHRDVWVYYNEEIPKGYQVHHIHSRGQNDITDVVCISESEHKAHHILDRMDKMEEKEYVCAECKKTFKSKRMYSVKDDRVFCSPSCNKRYVYFNEEETRMCTHCGKPFFAHKYKPKDFCSRKCMLGSKITTCPMCENVFIPDGASQKYCSKKCGDNYRYKQKHIEEWTKKCPHCGKIFVAKKTDQIYCCNICGQVERTKVYRAKKKLLQTK